MKIPSHVAARRSRGSFVRWPLQTGLLLVFPYVIFGPLR